MVKKRTALNSDRSCWRCRRSSRGGEISGRRCLKMKSKLKKWLRPLLFTIGGALAGLGYYYAVGCSTGSCPITSNPIITMIYMGVVGLLLSGLFGKGCDGKCNM